MTDIGASTVRSITLRLVVPLLVLLVLSTIDRVNVSFAALQMNADLGLTASSYGLGVSIFFVGYILAQLPSLALLQRIGMRRWVFTLAAIWGCAATGMAFVHSKEGFYALRVVLGIAEAGYAPGLTFYLSSWVPQRYRAGMLSRVMLAVPISVLIGGPLSGWLMSIDNPVSLPGWRWMLLVEGIPTLLLALAARRVFTDKPDEARWLSVEQRAWLTDELAREHAEHPGATERSSIGELVSNGRLWAATACWFALMAGAQGLIAWLPQVIKHLSANTTTLDIGFISTLPWIAIGAGMLVNAWHSDRMQERYLHVAVPIVLGAALLALTAFTPNVAALLIVIVSGFFMGGAQGTFWTIPATFLKPAALALGIGIVNMCGNLAGLIVPYATGWIRERTGSFDMPILALAATMLIGAIALFAIRERDASVQAPIRASM